MMMTEGLFTPDQVLHADKSQVGAKAHNIAQMSKVTNTPAAHVVGSALHDLYREKGEEGLTELRDWLAGMPPGNYAVRSSGSLKAGEVRLFEDGAGLSMAGWFESIIGVASGELFDAIIACYKAVDSFRIGRMTAALDRKSQDVSLAIILQPYVSAVRSAVLYTVDPFRPGPGTYMLASGTWGACHALVAGETTGDTYRIPRDGGSPQIIRISSKPWMWILEEGSGLVRKATPSAQVQAPCFTSDDLISLKDIGFLLERHFGQPQDVELVHSGSAWVPVQSRPLQRATS
jgi:phosphoenolpyruvate synthase/pyruvate phosphate dikinase